MRDAIIGVGVAFVALFGLLVTSQAENEVISAIGTMMFVGGVGTMFVHIHRLTGT